MIRNQRKVKGSKKAFIFGPFIGELYWEMYRFAPYAISLKKRFPNYHLIVFTRSRSFDLYGQYASILVPLKIDDNIYKEDGFKIKGYYVDEYVHIYNFIEKKYMKTYKIVDHYAPRIEGFMYKVKWQFPRAHMDYDYKPRSENSYIINKVYEDLTNIVVTNDESIELENYNVITSESFYEKIKYMCTESSSTLGCLIELLKKCKFVISNFDDDLAKFAVLCGTSVITVKEKFTNDAINLMNPLKSVVIKCDTVDEGIDQYEDYFRS